jgi:hypothetical protein
MTDRATAGDNPTQDDVTAAAVENGEAFFASGTDPAVAPVAAHREAHAEGGEYATDDNDYDDYDDVDPIVSRTDAPDAGNVPSSDVDDPAAQNTVTIGGQTMTQAQYDAVVNAERGTPGAVASSTDTGSDGTVPPATPATVTE